VHGSGRDIAALARGKGPRLAVRLQRHFAGQYNVRGFGRVSKVRIVSVWTILPNVSVDISLVAKLLRERLFIDGPMKTHLRK